MEVFPFLCKMNLNSYAIYIHQYKIIKKSKKNVIISPSLIYNHFIDAFSSFLVFITRVHASILACTSSMPCLVSDETNIN